MSTESQLKEALGMFVKGQRSTSIVPLKVTNVDEAEGSIDGTDPEDIEIFDVRLQAALDGSDKGVFAIPKINSWVLAGNIGKSDNSLVVLSLSEIEKAVVRIGTTEIEVDEQGVVIKKGAENLKDVLSDFLDAIMSLTVSTSQGPSGTPINISTFASLKTRLNSVLK